MHARLGFATGQVIQRVLVGRLPHNIEGVGSRTGQSVASKGAFGQKIQGDANNDEPDHINLHEESVTVREGGGKARLFGIDWAVMLKTVKWFTDLQNYCCAIPKTD